MGRKKQTSGGKTVDPELERQLDAADDDTPVQAVFTLKTPAGEPYRSAASTKECVSKMIDAAATTAKGAPERLNVFPNLQSFTVAGKPSLVRSLMSNDQVASAMANQQPEDLQIRPARKKEVTLRPPRPRAKTNASLPAKKKTKTAAKKKRSK